MCGEIDRVPERGVALVVEEVVEIMGRAREAMRHEMLVRFRDYSLKLASYEQGIQPGIFV